MRINFTKNLKGKIIIMAFFFIIFGFTNRIFAQKESDTIESQKIVIRPDKLTMPTYCLKLDSQTIKADSSIIRQLNPNWIRKAEILKEAKYRELFDCPMNEAIILVIIKKKYITEVREIINAKSTDPKNYGTQQRL